jgi:hypothetical protein
MTPAPDFLTQEHDPRDPSPWLALYLDRSTPFMDHVKVAWLRDASSRSRQFLLPVVRPLARSAIVVLQLVKILVPHQLSFSIALHKLLAWGLRNFVRPEGNWLILRHFHLGGQALEFIARNAPAQVETSPLTPRVIADLEDETFLKHDLNLFNFVIRLNKSLRNAGLQLKKAERPDFSMVRDPGLRLEDLPNRWTNFLDLETAIELFTPIYQLFLTDNDFWRAANSLQLDETIGIYVATILDAPQHLILLNNKHPLAPESTLRTGHRLVLHGLSTEMLHALLMKLAADQRAAESGQAAA